jgi:hypothetical protein
MDIVTSPAWGGGVDFEFNGQRYWARNEERAQAFVARMQRVQR